MILFRYFTKEIFKAFGAISLILLLIFFSHQTVKYLKFTALGTLSGSAVLHLLFLEIPQLLSLIFPLAWYLSIWFVYRRSWMDNEIIVLKACGFSEKKVLGWTAAMTVGAAFLLSILVFWINPLMAKSRDVLLNQMRSVSVLKILQPGYFQKSNDGEQVFYIESLSDNKRVLKNIFAAEHKEKNFWAITSAQQGYYTVEPATRDDFMVVKNAYRYEGMPGEKNFMLYHLGEYGIRLNVSMDYFLRHPIDAVSMRDLFLHRAKNLAYHAEWQWRISLPMSLFVLAFFAFLLSNVKPREGRFSGFFLALLIYIIYADFMLVGQDWISKGQFPVLPGLWALHGSMWVAGAGLYAYQRSFFKRYFFKINRKPASGVT